MPANDRKQRLDPSKDLASPTSGYAPISPCASQIDDRAMSVIDGCRRALARYPQTRAKRPSATTVRYTAAARGAAAVTLVLSLQSRDTIWVVADRRLSYPAPFSPRDDAVKMLVLETLDGISVLAYAGLGATTRKMQPSAWMNNVVRGLGGLSIEQALAVLADAANEELGPFLPHVGSHTVIAPSFITNHGPAAYVIDDRPVGGIHIHNFVRLTSDKRVRRPPPILLAGTGGAHLERTKSTWQRPLRSLAAACDRRAVTEEAVADELARLALKVHRDIGDQSVGPSAIVIWRRRPDAKPGPGGAHQFYVDGQRVAPDAAIPMISNGLDVAALAKITLEAHIAAGFGPLTESGAFAEFDGPDPDDVDRRISKVRWDPDPRLR